MYTSIEPELSWHLLIAALSADFLMKTNVYLCVVKLQLLFKQCIMETGQNLESIFEALYVFDLRSFDMELVDKLLLDGDVNVIFSTG